VSLEKVARLPGAPERARRLFLDLASWPDWLPGVLSVRREETREDTEIVTLEQLVAGRRARQTVEIRPTTDGFRQRRIAGEPRRWDLAWSFRRAPVDGETTLHLTIDYDFGLWSLVVPRRVAEAAIDRHFEELVAEASRRLQDALLHESASMFTRNLPSRFHLRIEERQGTLYVFFDGKHYRAEPVG
jgi:hypothetical protein